MRIPADRAKRLQVAMILELSAAVKATQENIDSRTHVCVQVLAPRYATETVDIGKLGFEEPVSVD